VTGITCFGPPARTKCYTRNCGGSDEILVTQRGLCGLDLRAPKADRYMIKKERSEGLLWPQKGTLTTL
jgi:hypothetical protein